MIKKPGKMSDITEDMNLIRKFFDNDISKDELIIFKAKIKNNRSFANEVREQAELKAVMKAAGKLPKTVSIGGCVRWRLSDIEMFLNKGGSK